jgi:hypothetical protein
MKKFFSAIVLFSLLGILLVPAMASAQVTTCKIRHVFVIGTGEESVPCGTAGAVQICTFGGVTGSTIGVDDPENCSQCCGVDLIYTITDWIFFLTIAIAILFIIVGGFMFVTAAGSPEKALSARSYLIYAAIGIAIALISKAIPSIAISLFGLGGA